MRRLLRWVMHGVMGVMLLLAIACLIAWPLSIYWRSVTVSRLIVRAIDPTHSEPHGLELTNFSLALWGGDLLIQTDPTSTGAYIFGDQQYLALEDTDQSEWISRGRAQTNWWRFHETPRGYQPGRIDLHFAQGWRNSHLNIPIGIVGIILLLLSTTWFATQVIGPMFLHRTRLQTNLCLHCGYNLTGLRSDTCPECGANRPMVTVRESV